MIKIFIDAGHNPLGWNAGAEGNGMREQDIVFEVSILLADMLKSNFDIKLSRTTKETILGTNNSTAITIQDTYSQAMNLRNRRTEKRDNLAVIRHTNYPSILIELGFIDHKEDAIMLKTKRLEMAKAISKGIYKFLGVTQTENNKDTENIKEDEEMRYNNVNEVPDWGKSTIQKLISLEILNGNGNGLNLTEDMVRLLVMNDRAGIYGDVTAQGCVEAPVRFSAKEIDIITKDSACGS